MTSAALLHRRSTRAVLTLLGALPVALILGAMVLFVVSLAGETTMVGRRGGPWKSYPTWQVQAVALTILLPLCALFLWRVAAAMVRVAKTAAPSGRAHAAARGLALGEPILWQGRQGWRGFTVGRIALLGLAAAGPAVFLMLMWRIWSGSDILMLKLFWTAFGLLIFAGSIGMALIAGPGALRRCYHDLFGTMIVTDRRVAWLTPWNRTLYREVPGGTLLAATLVEGGAHRGWIAVVQQDGDRVKEVDLRGVPEPVTALSSLARLVRPRV